MTPVYLRVRAVSLDLPHEVQRGASRPAGLLAALSGSDRRMATVLHGIDFELREGDRLALLGLNGAGKTTLLRVLNGAFPPSSGRVERKGTVQSLLNATLGFDERCTVLENVFLRGTAMGLRRRQIEPVLADILEFAGLADRLHYRLHDLSAGQKMRLGFALSTAVQPDILLMDEWIAAGDAAFVERAQKRLLGRFHGSRIVVLASHNTALLRELCNKALVLDNGRMRFFGEVADGLDAYREIVGQADRDKRTLAIRTDPLLFGNAAGLVERVTLLPEWLQVEGWACSGRYQEIKSITVEVAGRSIRVMHFERVDRDDVRRHLAKSKGAFGFRFKVPAHRINFRDIPSRLLVKVGSHDEDDSTPLSLAPGAILEVNELCPESKSTEGNAKTSSGGAA